MLACSCLCAAAVMGGAPKEPPSAGAREPDPPRLVTARTRSSPEALARLERAGKVLFRDGFESERSLDGYFEVRGREAGHARVVLDPGEARRGRGVLRLTAPARDGAASGSGVEHWFGPEGHERVHLRTYIRFAADYDQGHLNHTGPSVSGVAGTNKWGGMGGAGQRPRGDDHFNTRLETWCDWGRVEPPGYLFMYTYWMEMRRDRDGSFWGNMLGPAEAERIVPVRDRWHCVEEMVKVNRPGEADGELAAWVDGRLYLHYEGIRWRSSEDVRLKRFSLIVYVHRAARDNTVWFDEVVLSTGYIGPEAGEEPAGDGSAPKGP